MEKLDPIKLNDILSEFQIIKATIRNIREDVHRNSDKWRQTSYDDRFKISLISDEIKCEAKWLSEWLDYLGRS